MGAYKYEAVDMMGEPINGEIEAMNRDQVVATLKQRGYYPTSIEEQTEVKDVKELDLFLGKVSKKVLAIFCQQFGTVIEAGVPMIQALEILMEQMTNKQLKNALEEMYEDVQAGTALSVSMARFPKVFPTLLVSMVEAGEMSGTLDDAFKKMSVQFEKSYKIDQKVRSSMIYPSVLAVVSVAVVWFLLARVVPTFVTLFQSSGAALPGPTQFLLNVSDYVQNYGLITFVGVVVALVIFRIWISKGTGRLAWHRFLMKLPVIKTYIKNVLTARFTRTMGTLTATGVSLERSLNVVSKILNNAVAEKAMDEIVEQINSGVALAAAVQEQKLFPIMVIQMIRIGEQAGSLDDMLEKTSIFYEAEVETSVQQLTALMEPAIIVVLGGIVAFIVLAIMLPVFEMYTLIG